MKAQCVIFLCALCANSKLEQEMHANRMQLHDREVLRDEELGKLQRAEQSHAEFKSRTTQAEQLVRKRLKMLQSEQRSNTECASFIFIPSFENCFCSE